MLVFLNGEILDENDAKISISDLSYQFGYGLFETIKCEQSIPVFFESHFKRLTHSAKEIGMPFPIEGDEIKSWIVNLLSASKLTNARVRITISKRIGDKFNVLILALPLGNQSSSYSLLGYTLGRDSRSVSFRHKTTSRADSYVAFTKAQEQGFNDAVYVNEKNELIECTRANIFLVMEDKIITPVLESGILSGVTRAKLLDIAKEENFLLEEKIIHSLYLNKAKEVFASNAIIGVMPVSKIKFDDKEYNFLKSEKTILIKKLYDKKVSEYILKNRSLSKQY